jgi:hypothetical protein
VVPGALKNAEGLKSDIEQVQNEKKSFTFR